MLVDEPELPDDDEVVAAIDRLTKQMEEFSRRLTGAIYRLVDVVADGDR